MSLLVVALALGGVADAKRKAKRKAPGPVVTRSSSSTGSGAGAVVSATATCPKKTRAISGGFSETVPNLEAVAGIVFESQRATARSWRVSAQIRGSGAPVTLTSHVYCRRRAPKLAGASTTLPTGELPGAAFGPTATASCRGKRRALAGGFVTPAPLVGGSVKNLVAGSLPGSPRDWTALAISTPVGASSVSAFAYCAKAKELPGLSRAGATGPATAADAASSTVTTPPCAGKRRALAGGFSQTTTGTPSGGFFLPYESVRAEDGRSWRVSGIHEDTGAGSLIASAVCG
ncbi:MAG TPA: hypothetical protein VFN15_00195 [Solirubrobacterales bacterium]|nr:hypothetical protein [Solirubrobacterales bacterium]